MKARLKDGFGGRHMYVKGPSHKVKSHLMFGILALSMDRLVPALSIRRFFFPLLRKIPAYTAWVEEASDEKAVSTHKCIITAPLE